MSKQIFSVILLTVNLFIGSIVPSGIRCKQITEDGTSEGELAINEYYYYATCNDSRSEFNIIDSSSELVEGQSYSIIFTCFNHDCEGKVDFLDFEESKPFYFEYKHLEKDGNTFKEVEETQGSEYLICTFIAKHRIDEINITNFNLSANEKVTISKEMELSLSSKVAGDSSISDQEFIDTVKSNISFIYYDGSTGEQVSDKLVPNNPYYIFMHIQYMPNVIFPDNFALSINGKPLRKFEDGYRLDFVANEKTKSTDLEYAVGESYTWSITNSQDQDISGSVLNILTGKVTDAVDEIKVKVTDLKLKYGNKLQISVESENDWTMKDQNVDSNRSGGYSIHVKEDDVVTDNEWKDNPIILKVSSEETIPEGGKVSSGVFKWNEDIAPTKSGIYRDLLTFTSEIIEVKTPKKGQIIKLVDGDEKIDNDYQYLVMDVDGANIKLLCIDSLGVARTWSSDTVEYQNGGYYLDYEKSFICDAYSSFKTSLSELVKSNIVPQNIETHVYKKVNTIAPDTHKYLINYLDNKYYYVDIDHRVINNQDVFALDLEDIFEYFDKTEIDGSEILNNLCFDDADKTRKVGPELRSVIYEDDSNTLKYGYICANEEYGGVYAYFTDYSSYGNDYQTFAAMVLDMSDIDYTVVE